MKCKKRFTYCESNLKTKTMRLRNSRNRQILNSWEIQSLKRRLFEWKELLIWSMEDPNPVKQKEASIQIGRSIMCKLAHLMKSKRQRSLNMKIKLFRRNNDNLFKKEWYQGETLESNKEILILHRLNLMPSCQKLKLKGLLWTLALKSRYQIIPNEELNEFES